MSRSDANSQDELRNYDHRSILQGLDDLVLLRGQLFDEDCMFFSLEITGRELHISELCTLVISCYPPVYRRCQ